MESTQDLPNVSTHYVIKYLIYYLLGTTVFPHVGYVSFDRSIIGRCGKNKNAINLF